MCCRCQRAAGVNVLQVSPAYAPEHGVLIAMEDVSIRNLYNIIYYDDIGC